MYWRVDTSGVFISDSHAICGMMGVAGVATFMSRVLEAAHNRMLGIVLVVVLMASEESVQQEAP